MIEAILGHVVLLAVTIFAGVLVTLVGCFVALIIMRLLIR